MGLQRAVATAQDERILNEKRIHCDKPYDVRPAAGASLSDLDMRFFEQEYLPAAFAPDVLESNDRTVDQRLQALKFSSSGSEPTNLGLIVLGISPRDSLPGAYVQFLRIEGVEMADPIGDEATIDGRIDEVIRRTEDKFAAHNTSEIDITSSSTEIRRPKYPSSSLQQIFRNAVMHRTYEASNSPVRIYWFNDRVEILSPGGPFGAVSLENFGTPGATDYRNPNLAESMKVLGFVQQFGVGIATARKQLLLNENPPLEFQNNARFISAVLKARA